MNRFNELRECIPNNDFITSVFKFDVRYLEQASDVFISQSIIGLAQYLIYFKSTYNSTKAEITQKQRLLESSIFTLMTDDIVKKQKTKKDARQWMINNMEPLAKLDQEIESLQNEVYMLDGIDKTISELIAAFKRELTRRENEFYNGRRASH